jgi:hypothetical protein
MLAKGDAVQYDNGPIIYPPNFFSSIPSPPGYGNIAPPSPVPESEPSPAPSELSDAAARFLRAVDAHQDVILLAAHPSGEIENVNTSVRQGGPNSATVVDNVSWRGPSGRTYETIFNFLASEAGKQALLRYAGNKMESQIGRGLVRLVNNETSVAGALKEFLREISNK